MNVRRVVVSVSAAAVMSALFAAAAYACEEPTFTVLTDRAGPGDAVRFSVSGTEEGAGFRLYTSDRQWSRAFTDTTAGDNGYTGTFEMPDFGSESRTVHINFSGAHDGQTFTPQGSEVYYEAPPPPPQSNDASESSDQKESSKNDRSGGRRHAPDEEATTDRAAPRPVTQPVRVADNVPVAEKPSRAASEVRQARRTASERTQDRPVSVSNDPVAENDRPQLPTVPVEQPAAVPTPDTQDPWWIPVVLVALVARIWMARRRVPAADRAADIMDLPRENAAERDAA